MSASGKCFKRRVFNMADENTERRRTLILLKIVRLWNKKEKADNAANDESNSEQEAKVKSEIRVNQIADWMEKQEENSERRILKQWAADSKEELSLANKELTAVRRAQLHKLLYTEQALYEMELNEQGKSFFIQRT